MALRIKEARRMADEAQKWEYVVEIPEDSDVKVYLNTMGEQGWELVAVGDFGVEPAESLIH